MNQKNSMNPKVVWAIVGVAVVVLLGYLASRVGNIGARSVRNGAGTVELSVSTPAVPGVPIMVHWNTSLGVPTSPVILKARTGQEEVQVGRGEFGAGQATLTIPCEMGGDEIGLGLYQIGAAGVEELITQTTLQVLPAGPDCLR